MPFLCVQKLIDNEDGVLIHVVGVQTKVNLPARIVLSQSTFRRLLAFVECFQLDRVFTNSTTGGAISSVHFGRIVGDTTQRILGRRILPKDFRCTVATASYTDPLTRTDGARLLQHSEETQRLHYVATQSPEEMVKLGKILRDRLGI